MARRRVFEFQNLTNKDELNMSHKDHFLTLDGFRGIAAILVVLRHTIPYFGQNPFFSSYLAVDLFFLLSGAVVARSYEHRLRHEMSLRKFMWIRLLRLYPLYFLGIGIGIFAAAAKLTDFHGNLPVAAVVGLLMLPGLHSYLLFPLNGPAWSLSSEIIANFVYGWRVRWLSDRVLSLVMLICLTGMVLYVALSAQHSLDAGFHRRTYYVSLLRVGFSFSAGILLYRWFLTKGKRAVVSNGKAALTVLAVALLLMMSPPASLMPFYDVLAVSIGFPLLVYAGMRYQPSGSLASACQFLGVISYPIYIVHSPLAELLRHAFPSLTGGHEVAQFTPWGGLVFLAALIGLAWLLHHFYDTPVRKLLGDWMSRKRAAMATAQAK